MKPNAKVPTPNSMPGSPAPMPGASPTTFELDFTEVTQGFTIPDGDYRMVCVDVEQGISQAGNPQIIWTFAVKEGNYKGREFKYFTAQTPAAMWKVAETAVSLGLGVIGQKVKFTRSEAMGKECIATIEEREYKGKTNSNISSVSPAPAAK